MPFTEHVYWIWKSVFVVAVKDNVVFPKKENNVVHDKVEVPKLG
jgi:hypothetical protein